MNEKEREREEGHESHFPCRLDGISEQGKLGEKVLRSRGSMRAWASRPASSDDAATFPVVAVEALSHAQD